MSGLELLGPSLLGIGGTAAAASLFKGRKAPAVPEAPPAPTINDAEAAGQEAADRLRRRRGMASTILAGANTNTPQTQAAALLGS